MAWAAGWLAVGAPDAGVDARVVSVVAWGAASGSLILLLALRRRANRSSERRARRRARALVVLPAVVVACVAAALVAHAAATALAVRAGSPLHRAAADHAIVDIIAEVTSAPRALVAPATMPWLAEAADGGGTVRFDVRVTAVGGAEVAPVSATVNADASGDLVFGAGVAFRADVRQVEAAEAQGFRLRPVGDVHVEPPLGVLDWAAELRRAFADAAERLPGDGGALVPGLAIGDTGAVGVELDTAMKLASLSHLTAVSGANCAIVTALAFALAAACRLPRSMRVVLALVALLAFIALVTPESSVVRAGAMAVVVLVATATGRTGGGVAALSVAVIVLLVADPWYARDYGFALSVCATAGLLLLAGPLGTRLARVMPAPLAVVIAVPLAAQLACQPVLILLDASLALYGVPANLLAGPAAPIGTVAGLVGCLLLPVLPSVGVAALQVAWVPASWIALVAHGVAELPAARLPWLPDAPGAILLAGVTGASLWLVSTHRRPRWAVRAVGLLTLVALAIPLGILVGGPAITRAGAPGDWAVAACDVGQGDAVLLRSGGRAMLVDTGPEPAALSRCLELTGVLRIDVLVLTHWDADHVGGAAAVAGRVGAVLHGPLDGPRSARVLDPLRAGGATTAEATIGRRGVLGDLAWTVLWPPEGEPPGNDASVVLETRAAEWRGLFLGDLGEEAQSRLRARTHLTGFDLVKVAHHGSADQSAAVYEDAAATVGIVGVGADNGYGHPTERALELLRSAGTAVVRTDAGGTALLSVDDGRFRLWSERAPPPPAAAGMPRG
ncbi:ComEC/Rec2 family competence protein [Agromyces sp. G08B096]|uniref:ComEC/Rec2 family competence protein n=1 Tax=Agromyces sp. G08B096 TaxID=3156399 RepID=A0AAU7W2X3_9MICO